MAYNLKEVIAEKPSRFTAGHRMCAGCGAPAVARMILRAVHPEDHVVVANATGCMEVSTFIYPYTAWTDSYIHTAFECASATESGATSSSTTDTVDSFDASTGATAGALPFATSSVLVKASTNFS